MSIYTVVFWFYALTVGWMVTVLGCRWVKQVEERMSIEKITHARALQDEAYPKDLGIEATVEPRPRFGLLDPDWKYVKSEQTDIRKTFREHRAQVLSQKGLLK